MIGWWQVEKAESVLVEIKRLIDKQVADKSSSGEFRAEVARLSDEFYSHLPHDNKHRVVVDSKRIIASKQQLCQVSVHLSLSALLPESTYLEYMEISGEFGSCQG